MHLPNMHVVLFWWDEISIGPEKFKIGGYGGVVAHAKLKLCHYTRHSELWNMLILIFYFTEKHPWISYSDLWILAGVCAIQEMQGPIIPYRPGRNDRDVAACTPDGRLPDATKGARHLRDIFFRMGFDDREIVALSGAHALGRCHTDRSGFSGPWTFSPTVVTNDYYKLLLDEKWQWKKVTCFFLYSHFSRLGLHEANGDNYSGTDPTSLRIRRPNP